MIYMIGMFVLRRPPPARVNLLPEPFVVGSRVLLCRVVDAITHTFKGHMPEVVAEWIDFRDNIAPQDDDAVRFVETKGMHVVLKLNCIFFIMFFIHKVCMSR
jgi:hypothetical protein